MTHLSSRYKDLFVALVDTNPERSDIAFDHILFEREFAVPALVEFYQVLHNQTLSLGSSFERYSAQGSSDSSDNVNRTTYRLINHDFTHYEVYLLTLNVLQLMGFSQDSRCIDALSSCLEDSPVCEFRIEACKAVEDLKVYDERLISSLESCIHADNQKLIEYATETISSVKSFVPKAKNLLSKAQ